ncbi:DUF2919 family protein [Glaciecola siphonariae]|uniref:DUF2919 family protein n=1 Tax=Glaciecola siphonariae TaxID=521012 RepID=A0ABV9LRJ2_9ALTE
MPLKFPLHHYDEAGRLKPPLLLYAFLLFLCRGFLLLIISLSFREDSSRMMSLFFPNKWDFYLSLLPSIPALIILILFAQRSKIWLNERQSWFKVVPILFVIALVGDIAIQLNILSRLDFRFSLTHGLSILLALIGLIYAHKSRHVRELPIDWAKAN